MVNFRWGLEMIEIMSNDGWWQINGLREKNATLTMAKCELTEKVLKLSNFTMIKNGIEITKFNNDPKHGIEYI